VVGFVPLVRVSNNTFLCPERERRAESERAPVYKSM